MDAAPDQQRLYREAQDLMPGGVNSPVRAYKGVGGTPVFIERAQGCRVVDVDGKSYVDLVLAYGPHILGHCHPAIHQALTQAIARGTAFGAPTEAETILARLIRERMPWAEKVRLVNSGTEATMSAVRLARAATDRTHFIKFNGNYHGHADGFLVKAGSGALTLGAPDSSGVPAEVAALTLVAEYNDLPSVQALMKSHGDRIAAIIVEPVAGNVGLINPAPDFLAGLQRLCVDHGSLLIFDEVMTGFRVARGGYAEICGIRPDLVCLGKVIGGGLPVAAYGGKEEIMDLVAPMGPMYQAGTLSGNPIGVAAGIAALRELDHPGTYQKLEESGAYLEAGLLDICRSKGIEATVNRQGSMMALYFTAAPVVTYGDALKSDRGRFTRFFHGMRERGVLLPPSPFESWFLSTAHDRAALDEVLEAARAVL